MKTLLCWLLVAAPLAWGITQSVKKAAPLFARETGHQNNPSPR